MSKGRRSQNFIRSLQLDEDTEMSMDLSTLNNAFGRVSQSFGHNRGLDVLCYFETKRTLIEKVSEDDRFK